MTKDRSNEIEASPQRDDAFYRHGIEHLAQSAHTTGTTASSEAAGYGPSYEHGSELYADAPPHSDWAPAGLSRPGRRARNINRGVE